MTQDGPVGKSDVGCSQGGARGGFLTGIMKNRRSVVAVVLAFIISFQEDATGTLLRKDLTFRWRAVVVRPRKLKQTEGDHNEGPELREFITPAGLTPAEDPVAFLRDFRARIETVITYGLNPVVPRGC